MLSELVATTALGLVLWVGLYVLFVLLWLQFVIGTDAVSFPNLASVGFVV